MSNNFNFPGGNGFPTDNNDDIQGGQGGQGTPTTPSSGLGAQAQNRGGSEIYNLIDPNDIHVSISTKAPTIILFAPRTGGKTMSLIRLCRWLIQNGYAVKPDYSFRADKYYKEECDNFEQKVYHNYAAEGTSRVDFILITVSQRGRNICQILEAPGEDYFDEDPKKMRELPRAYQAAVFNGSNPRTWVFFLEHNGWAYGDVAVRERYAQVISQRINLMPKQDRVLLVSSKVDQAPELFENGKPNVQLFHRAMREQYPAVFSNLRSGRFISSGKPYEMTAFSSGTFSKTQAGTLTYTPSADLYPKNLWEKILSTLRN